MADVYEQYLYDSWLLMIFAALTAVSLYLRTSSTFIVFRAIIEIVIMDNIILLSLTVQSIRAMHRKLWLLKYQL